MEESAIEYLILVVEDNANHAELIETALSTESTKHHIVRVKDGAEALRYLKQREEFAEAARPHLILLDLNLPQKNGSEILAEIKADSSLKRIPIVVLTASNDEEDVFKIYELQGNCYVIKSTDLAQLSVIVKRIKEFWLGIVTLPTE